MYVHLHDFLRVECSAPEIQNVRGGGRGDKHTAMTFLRMRDTFSAYAGVELIGSSDSLTTAKINEHSMLGYENLSLYSDWYSNAINLYASQSKIATTTNSVFTV
jgi:hypothetical protein